MKRNKKRILILFFLGILFLIFFLAYYKRSFYCNDSVCITVWNVRSNKSYIIKGKYFGINPPKKDYVKVYSSKPFYVCWNDENTPAFSMGSVILEQEGFGSFNFYSHNDFFKKFTGQTYIDGINHYDSLHAEKKKKYNIQHIKP